MSQVADTSGRVALDPDKFRNPDRTRDGQKRAEVALTGIETLWFNTGTLCNLTCANCYIESSPTNDRLVYLTAGEVATLLDELDRDWQAREIGFTGGEPFMNPDIIATLEDALSRGYRVLVLTNAMRPMMKHSDDLLRLHERYGAQLCLRVSIDHYTPELHEIERGAGAWQRMLPGLRWLAEHGLHINIAGRSCWRESEAQLRDGYARLFAEHGLALNANSPLELVLFPEMDETADVPEITEACLGILDVSPDTMMCASSRMVVKRKGAAKPSVLACTLLPYDQRFELGDSLATASGAVKLNHPHCARFCVLGGGACSVASD